MFAPAAEFETGPPSFKRRQAGRFSSRSPSRPAPRSKLGFRRSTRETRDRVLAVGRLSRRPRAKLESLTGAPFGGKSEMPGRRPLAVAARRRSDDDRDNPAPLALCRRLGERLGLRDPHLDGGRRRPGCELLAGARGAIHRGHHGCDPGSADARASIGEGLLSLARDAHRRDRGDRHRRPLLPGERSDPRRLRRVAGARDELRSGRCRRR